MRRVDATGFEEAKRSADAEVVQDGKGLDILQTVSVSNTSEDSYVNKLTADLVAPPFAPVAGVAPLKENTVNFLRASPVSNVSP